MYIIPSEQEVQEAIQGSQQRKPSIDSWGLYACDDGTDEKGGGVGGFGWFDTQQELIEFIYSFPLFGKTGQSGSDPSMLFLYNEVRKRLEAARSSSVLDRKTVDSINNLLTGIEQIKWRGQLQDLMTGDDQFAVDLRTMFWAGKQAAEIDNSVLNEFTEFLYALGT